MNIRAILAALIVLASLLWCAPAAAQDYTSCYDVTMASAVCPDRQIATAQASAAADYRKKNAGEDSSKILAIENSQEVGYCWADNGVNCLPATGATRSWTVECTAGKVWDASTKTCELGCPGGFKEDPANPGQCMDADKCRAKPALGNAFTIGGSGTTCVDGCQFAPPVSVCSNGVCAVSGAIGTGAACGVGDLPPQQNKDQQCTPAGSGQTYCVKADGRQCYSAGNGRQVCWRPGETGEKPDNDVLQKRDAGTEPVAPNVNLPNNDTLTPKDSPVVSNTQVKDGSGTRNITTVTQNYGTVNGTNAGSGNQGENGDGTGGGEGDGEGDGEGSPGEGVGELYEGEGRTVAEVFGEFKQRVTNAPIASAGTQFFTVSVGGSCPTWTVPASDYWRAMVFDFHCSQTMLQAFAWGAMLLMAVAAFVAFKWGFL